ncbi:MAG: hypothetical protein AB9835_05970 [Eubacteriales bacterium]
MTHLSEGTTRLLEDIERRISPDAEEDFVRQWSDFTYDRFSGDLFRPVRRALSGTNYNYRNININDAIQSYEDMLVSQLELVSRSLGSEGQVLCVRANYGTGIMTSLFGARIFTMPRETNTLPTTYSFNDTDKIRALLEKGIPPLDSALGERVFEMGELYAEVFSHYPKISRYVSVYHPDTQGPLDICELLWGGEMFYAMYDEPELVHGLLRLVSDTYTAFLERWFRLFPPHPELNTHWNNLMFRGSILIRDDSAMNLSPELYGEYARPYDALLLERFGGGAVHFCGRGDHYIERLCSIPKMYGIAMSQPHLNDMEAIYRNTVDKGIKLLGFDAVTARRDVSRSGGFRGNIHVL